MFSFGISCKGKSEGDEKILARYTVKPKERLVLYGLDIHRVLGFNFADIEKTLGCKAKIDDEVAAVFIRIERDFANKEHKTSTKDSIDIIYGPVEDVTIYKDYSHVVPRTIAIYGDFKIDEKIKNKESIVKELKKNLPDNETANQIIEQIRKEFIAGNYKAELTLVIYFDIPKYPLSQFLIYFSLGELSYKYIFSKDKDPYPDVGTYY